MLITLENLWMIVSGSVSRSDLGSVVGAQDVPLPKALPASSNRLIHRLARMSLLAATDACMIMLATAIAYVLWAAPIRQQPLTAYLELSPFVLLFFFAYARAGLYPSLGLGPVEVLRRLSIATTFGFGVLATLSFVFRLQPFYSRVTFVLAYVLALVLVPLGRAALTSLTRRWHWFAEPVVVIGTGHRAVRAIRGITRAPHLGYRPALVLSTKSSPGAGELEGVPVAGGLDRVIELSARGFRVALLEVEPAETRLVLDRIQQWFRHVILLHELGDLPVEGLQVRNLGNLVGVEYTNNLLRPANQTFKRALDVVLGSTLLIVASPIILVSAVLVVVIDGWPAFFYQARPGLGTRRIEVPKIRTMRRDADRRLQECLDANVELREEWLSRHKLRNDPRLMPLIGRLFRRFSIDELPQLWTVVTGGMSLVGPRPFPDYHLEKFAPPFRELRTRVRPGITGLWQVTVRSDGGLEDQEAFDTYYIRNWSIWFDLYILARTVAAVAGGKGAY